MDATRRFDVLTNGANSTGNDLLQAEQISPEVLRDLFETALFDFTLDEDGDLLVQESYRVLVSGQRRGTIRFMSVFSFKPDSSNEARLTLCNRVNDGLVAIRASVHAPDALIIDWYLPTRGGVTKKAVVMAFRRFSELLDLVARYDSDDILS